MPDIPFFDAAGFFGQKISEVEQTLIAKQAELEILRANKRNLEAAVAILAQLDPAQQKAIQPELASLKEVMGSTERAIMGLESEIDLLSNKLAALQSARALLEVKDRP